MALHEKWWQLQSQQKTTAVRWQRVTSGKLSLRKITSRSLGKKTLNLHARIWGSWVFCLIMGSWCLGNKRILRHLIKKKLIHDKTQSSFPFVAASFSPVAIPSVSDQGSQPPSLLSSLCGNAPWSSRDLLEQSLWSTSLETRIVPEAQDSPASEWEQTTPDTNWEKAPRKEVTWQSVRLKLWGSQCES